MTAKGTEATTPPGTATPAMLMRIHLENDSVQSFVQADEANSFVKSWNELLGVISSKSAALQHA